MSSLPDDKPLSLYLLIFLILLDSFGSAFGMVFYEGGFQRIFCIACAALLLYSTLQLYTFKHDAPETTSKIYFARAMVSLISMPFYDAFAYRFGVFLTILWSIVICFWLSRKSVKIHYRRMGYYMHFNDPKQNEENFN